MIVLLESIHPDAHEILEGVGEVVLVDDPPTLDPALAGEEVRAVVTRGRGRIGSEIYRQLPNLEVVARCGTGLDNIDTSAAAEADVIVLHTPGSTTPAVAEHALMLMLGLARRVTEVDAAVKQGHWAVREGFASVEMRGKRLGIVGLGAIGTRVAELGLALDMDVVGWTRRDSRSPIPPLGLDELLRSSDVVQLCVALTPETTGMIGADQLTSMKPTALLINTARGPVVDHHALAAALNSGSLGGYAADVWDPEPPRAGDLTVAHPRVLVTPHVAALTDVTYREICVRTAEAVAAVLTGGEPDPSCVYRSSSERR